MHIEDLTATHHFAIQARQAYRAKYKGGSEMVWAAEGVYLALTDKDGSCYRRLCSANEARHLAAMLAEAADALDEATRAPERED